jgi:hypothetical protein
MRGGKEMNNLKYQRIERLKLEAWLDWKNTARYATTLGLDDAVLDLAPMPSDSPHKIYAKTSQLRSIIRDHACAEPDTGPCEEEKG